MRAHVEGEACRPDELRCLGPHVDAWRETQALAGAVVVTALLVTVVATWIVPAACKRVRRLFGGY
jgi:hypothetical protein